MVVFENIFKVVAAIVAGYIVGFILGSIFGALFGIFASFFVQDIVSPQHADSFSIFISLTLGGLISLFVSQVFNRLFETNINSFFGAIPGALIGLFLVVFVDGYFVIPDTNNYYHATIQSWAATPIMPYCSTIGRQIGTITFPLFGAIGITREMIKSRLELQRNRALMKDFPSSHWGMPDIPGEIRPIQASQVTRPFLFLLSHSASAMKKTFLFVLRALVITCAIGVTLSILGWQILGWHSKIQFSEGLFWASAILAVYGYFNRYLPFSSRYGETVGSMDIHERTSQWVMEAKKSFELSPNIFLVSGFLFGFSVLISIIS